MKNKIISYLTIGLLCFTIVGCGSNEAGVTSDEEAVEEVTSADITTTTSETKTIQPLPNTIDVNNLTDCTINVSFSADDFNWRGSNLTVNVYEEILYDTVDISTLAVGDTLVVDGENVEVKTLSDTGYCLMINEDQADQTMLAPEDGGTYYIMGYDDAVGMTNLGEAELMLADDVVLNDCGDMPEDSNVVNADELKTYLEGLSESRQNFDQQATRVLIENGEITEITRSWRP